MAYTSRRGGGTAADGGLAGRRPSWPSDGAVGLALAEGGMPRGGQVRTGRKQVWLTDETRGAVQAWAEAQGTSFSAALESLARLGLGQQPEQALAPALVSVVRRELQQQAHRLASLYASTAIEAGVTARLAGATLRTLREADYEQIKRAARIDAVAALRRRSALLELTADPAPATDGAPRRGEGGGDGHRQGELPAAGEDGADRAGAGLLHLPAGPGASGGVAQR